MQDCSSAAAICIDFERLLLPLIFDEQIFRLLLTHRTALGPSSLKWLILSSKRSRQSELRVLQSAVQHVCTHLLLLGFQRFHVLGILDVLLRHRHGPRGCCLGFGPGSAIRFSRCSTLLAT